MTIAEIRRQRREIARRKTEAAQLLARKTRRLEAERRERAAREDAAWAVKNHLDPGRIYQAEPRVMMSDFGGLRATPTAYELDRRSRRVDEILQSIGR